MIVKQIQNFRIKYGKNKQMQCEKHEKNNEKNNGKNNRKNYVENEQISNLWKQIAKILNINILNYRSKVRLQVIDNIKDLINDTQIKEIQITLNNLSLNSLSDLNDDEQEIMANLCKNIENILTIKD